MKRPVTGAVAEACTRSLVYEGNGSLLCRDGREPAFTRNSPGFQLEQSHQPAKWKILGVRVETRREEGAAAFPAEGAASTEVGVVLR